MTFSQNELHGLVLGGGKSSRMGVPKAEICFHDAPSWQYCMGLLQKYCCNVWLSISKYWSPPNGSIVDRELLIQDAYPSSFGPLTGILSAIESNPTASWLVLGCDMPFVDDEAIRYLIANRDKDKLVSAFRNSDGFPEPLFAIYEAQAYEVFKSFLGSDNLCPTSILRKLDVHWIDGAKEKWFVNVNTKEELEAMKAGSKECGKPEKQIEVLYFASLREQSKKDREAVRTKSHGVSELYEELAHKHGFRLKREIVRVAINDNFVPWHAEVREGDRVIFVPPVSGG